jgi:predicted TIM-barrel fold metal-dependent hydrolase
MRPSGAAIGGSVKRSLWLQLHQEEAIEPALAIVDPHHHLYQRPNAAYLLDALLRDLDCGHDVVGTVFVDSHAMYRRDGPGEMRCVGETEFANGVAAMSASGLYGRARVCAGIVSSARLEAGASIRAVLEAHLQAGNGRFRGVRRNSAWDPDPEIHAPTPGRVPGMLLDARFREGFAQLAPLGLSFDAFVFHTQLAELTELARAFPDTAIALDHCGTPLGIGRFAGRRAEVFEEWRREMAALARCTNVSVKLGGLGMRMLGFGFHAQPRPPSSEPLAREWRPYLETCIELFGPGRCMFESNFPVDRDSCSYGVLWNAFKRIASPLSPAERALLFSGTAARFYRLELPAREASEPPTAR